MAVETYHHGNLRAQLLERAQTVIEAHGIDALSLRELARESGVSHSAPRRHFADKQALLDALAIDGFTQLHALMSSASSLSGTYKDRLLGVALSYSTFATTSPALLSVMFSAKHGDSAPAELHAAGMQCLTIVTRLLSDAQENNAIATGDPEELAMAAFSTAHGAISLCTAGVIPQAMLSHAVSVSIEALWTGIGAKY